MEASFYRSVGYFSKLYEIPDERPAEGPFPLNVVADYHRLRNLLVTDYNPQMELIVSGRNSGDLHLVTAKGYSTEHILYYIPVEPFYQLRRDRTRKQAADLLSSVLAFCHEHMKIPYFTDSGTYLNDCYETIEGWYRDGYDGDEPPSAVRKVLNTLETFRKRGRKLRTLLQDPRELSQLEERVTHFQPTWPGDSTLAAIARQALALYQQYPNRHFMSDIPARFFASHADDRIYADQVFSFFWSSREDMLYRELMDYVSSHLADYFVIDEPVGYQHFSRPQATVDHDFSFAEAHIEFLKQLCDYLEICYG